MEPKTVAIQWLLVLFLNGSETGVVSGDPYPSRADCEKEGEIRRAMAYVQPNPEIQSLRHICVIQKKKAGA